MKRILLMLAILLLTAAVRAQDSVPGVIYRTGAPGVCYENRIIVDRVTGIGYVRVAGACQALGGGSSASTGSYLGMVKAAETGQNRTLSGLQTIDSYPVQAHERVLLLMQTDQTQNGIWTVSAGPWTRPTDFANGSVHPSGALIYVSEGAQMRQSVMQLDNALDDSIPFTVGTDLLNSLSRQVPDIGFTETIQGPVSDMRSWGRTDSSSSLGTGRPILFMDLDFNNQTTINLRTTSPTFVTSALFPGSTSGTATLKAPAVAGLSTITLPNASSTLPIFPQQITITGPTAARTWTVPDSNFTVAAVSQLGSIVGWEDTTTRTVAASSTQFTYANSVTTGAFNATEGNRQSIFPFNGTISNLFIRTSGAQPSDGGMTCLIRNSTTTTDSSISITISANAAAGTFSDTTHSTTVSAGDLITIKCTNASASVSAGIFEIRFVIVKN